jgi:hypothetical protein
MMASRTLAAAALFQMSTALAAIAQPVCEPAGPPTVAESVRFVVIGDFGEYQPNGQLVPDSQQVLEAIQEKHRDKPFQFGLTVGDNFYPRGTPTLAAIEQRWKPYQSVGIPFFASLGNHDYYRGRAEIQVLYDTAPANTASGRTWRMPCRYYSFAAGPVRFIALDTDEGSIGKARAFKRLLTFRFREAAWSEAQTAWLAQQLAATSSPWTIVYGHHPIFSRGRHGDTQRLHRGRAGRPSLRQLLESHNVTAYLAGHDHSLQRARSNGIDHLVVGAGGRGTTGVSCNGDAECEKLGSTFGFLIVEASPTVLTFEFFDHKGMSLIRWDRMR